MGSRVKPENDKFLDFIRISVVFRIRLIVVFDGGDGVITFKPAAKVDVGAAFAAKGLIGLGGGFPADGAVGKLRHCAGIECFWRNRQRFQ